MPPFRPIIDYVPLGRDMNLTCFTCCTCQEPVRSAQLTTTAVRNAKGSVRPYRIGLFLTLRCHGSIQNIEIPVDNG